MLLVAVLSAGSSAASSAWSGPSCPIRASLFDERPNPNRSIYTIVQTPLAFQSAVVRGGFKLLYSEWERRYYLWDLVRDAAERFNIADARPDLVQEMAARLQTWRSEQLGYYEDMARDSAIAPSALED